MNSSTHVVLVVGVDMVRAREPTHVVLVVGVDMVRAREPCFVLQANGCCHIKQICLHVIVKAVHGHYIVKGRL